MKNILRNGRPIHILVIDDDPSATDLLARLLTSKQVKVMTTNTSREGLQMVKEHEFDGIVLDLLMPDIPGSEVTGRIKEICQTPILIISAIDSPEMVTTALNNGADEFLSKPFSSNIFLARLASLIRRYHTEQLALPFGD
ncbi:MAG: response regulator transcription factor [Anaerolineales bacterium]|nr:response regulator transcription factor [Anaerolineales bacterium]